MAAPARILSLLTALLVAVELGQTRDRKYEERRLQAINIRVDWGKESGFRRCLVVVLLAHTRTHRYLVSIATSNVSKGCIRNANPHKGR